MHRMARRKEHVEAAADEVSNEQIASRDGQALRLAKKAEAFALETECTDKGPAKRKDLHPPIEGVTHKQLTTQDCEALGEGELALSRS